MIDTIVNIVASLVFVHYEQGKSIDIDDIINTCTSMNMALLYAKAYSVYKKIIDTNNTFRTLKNLKAKTEDIDELYDYDFIIEFMAKYEEIVEEIVDEILEEKEQEQEEEEQEQEQAQAEEEESEESETQSVSSDLSDYSELAEITGIDMNDSPREIHKIRHIQFKKVYAYLDGKTLKKKDLSCELPTETQTVFNTVQYKNYFYNPEYFEPYESGSYLFRLIKN